MHMRSLMYRNPRFYELSLRMIHGRSLDERYREISELVGDRSVFELGCGTGMLGRYVRKYSGMDLNRAFVRYASKKGIRCRVGDIFNDRWDKADVGIVVDVLHHITPREKELIERMRNAFSEVIVVEPITAFNTPMPKALRVIWDSTFGDANGINPLDNRMGWSFDVLCCTNSFTVFVSKDFLSGSIPDNISHGAIPLLIYNQATERDAPWLRNK